MSEVLFYKKNLVNINTLFVFSNKSILYEIIACFLSMAFTTIFLASSQNQPGSDGRRLKIGLYVLKVNIRYL